MTALTWRSGRNDEVIWLQYGDFSEPGTEAQLSLLRRREVRKVEVQLRLAHLDGGASRGAEIPRYARFSFESGKRDAPGVHGIGFITETRDGRACFTSGRGHQDEDLSVFHPVIDQIEDAFEIWVDDDTFFFPIDAKSRSTLIALFA